MSGKTYGKRCNFNENNKRGKILDQFISKSHKEQTAANMYGNEDPNDDDLFTQNEREKLENPVVTQFNTDGENPEATASGVDVEHNANEHNDGKQAGNAEESSLELIDETTLANMTDYEPAGIVKDSQMLLQAARSRNATLVTQILQKCPELKTDLKDEVGKTSLHHLCFTNNTDNIRMCAEKAVDINLTDKMGWTPLHYASMRGNKGVVEVLVGMGADCNIPDTQSKRTALHVAVSKSHTHIVNLLLLSGADPTLKDKDGNSVKDVCKNGDMENLIGDAVDTYGIADTMDIEKMQIEPNKTTPFLNLGITVKYVPVVDESETEANVPQPFVMTLQRSKDVTELDKYELQESDDLCSDEFTVKLRGTNDAKEVNVELAVDLIAAPSSKEELVFKTDTQQEISVGDIQEEHNKCRGTVSVNIASFTSFLVVSRPKLEKFEVGAQASTLTSTVDERVELDIQAGTFDNKVTISMEITEPPPKEEYKDVLAQCPDLSSTSAFYSLEAGNTDFSKPISVKIPLPSNYTGQGYLVILSMDKSPEDEKPEHWKPIDFEAKIVNNRVEFVVSSFSIKCAVETPRSLSRASSVGSMESFGSTLSILSQVSKVYRKARRKEYKVKFFCATRRQGTSNTFKVITECCKEDQVTARIAYWEGEGFKLQGSAGDLKNITPIVVNAKDKFSLKTQGIDFLDNDDVTLIEYHPKRQNNHKENTVTISETEKVTQGSIRLFKMARGARSESEDLDNEEEKVSELEVFLYKFHPDMLKEQDGKSFLTYNRMIDIQKELGDKWWKAILLLDITFSKVEHTLKTSGRDVQEKINWLLFDWRESSRSEKARGVPVLLSALSRCNKAGFVLKLRKHLVKWMNEPENKTDGFYEWLENAYKYDLILPIRRTKPMSDPFLAMLADMLKPTTELAQSLCPENGKDILNESIYVTTGLKTMKLLTSFRGRVSGSNATMTKLVDTLKEQKLTEPREYALMWTKAWVESSNKTEADQLDVAEFEQFLAEQKHN